jgi:hypothetical protein
MSIPAGGRLVLTTEDTSPLGLWGGKLDVSWSGDEDGRAKLRAGESVILADVSDHDRSVTVGVDVKGATHWRLAVEVQR